MDAVLKVAIVEDLPEIREGLAALIRGAPGFACTQAWPTAERAVAALPDGAREIVILHYIEGYACAEIAERLGIAEGTVKSQLHRARRLLKETMA